MTDREIRLKPNKNYRVEFFDVEITGWLAGKRTYLWFGRRECLATISGRTLYALAKRIAKEFESGRE